MKTIIFIKRYNYSDPQKLDTVLNCRFDTMYQAFVSTYKFEPTKMCQNKLPENVVARSFIVIGPYLLVLWKVDLAVVHQS